MKRILRLTIVWLLLVSLTAVAHAGPLRDYEDARDIYDSALACMAAYSNRLGHIGFARLEQENWKVKYFDINKETAEAKFLFLQKIDPLTGQYTVMLAVAGTETEKDVKSDLKYGQVHFAGGNLAEFAANAGEKDAADSLPKVHRGFNEVTQIALAADILEGPGELTIADYLLAHPAHKIILTGHSLGGAVATLYGARLLSMGVRPEQVKVITFGAPAVGNVAFADAFRDRLNLTRATMSGDQVVSVLQDVVGHYVQFGREIHWIAPDNIVMHPHHIPVYLNMAAKNYYQERLRAQQAGVLSLPLQAAGQGGERIYAAPVVNRLSPELQTEFFFMKEVLWDEYRAMFPGYVLATGDENLDASLAKAAAAGCDWLVTSEIGSRPSKTEEGVYFIGLQQAVYNVKERRLVNMFSSFNSTEQATPLGAFINGVRKMRDAKPLGLAGAGHGEKAAGR